MGAGENTILECEEASHQPGLSSVEWFCRLMMMVMKVMKVIIKMKVVKMLIMIVMIIMMVVRALVISLGWFCRCFFEDGDHNDIIFR